MNLKKILSFALASLILCLCLTSCLNGNKKSVMTVDSFEVPYEVYRYVALNSKWDIEAEYGKDVWQSENADAALEALKEDIKWHLATLYTVCSLAADYGLSWDDKSISAAVEIKMTQIKDEFEDDAAFNDGLEEAGLTAGAFEFILANESLIDEVYLKIAYADEKHSDNNYLRELFLGDSFIRVKQILVGGENAGTDEENLEIAQQIMDKLNNGEDFDVLCKQYNNDLYMFNNDIGYYITRGLRDVEFENAAFALEIGETSGIVKTASGYSIIKRYEKDEAYIDENFASLTDEYFESLYTSAFEERFEKILTEMPSLPDDIDLVELK